MNPSRMRILALPALLLLAACGPAPGKPTPVPATRLPESAYPGPDSSAYPGPSAALPAPVGADVPASSFAGTLAFHSERSGQLQIMAIDGQSLKTTPLTAGLRPSFEPAWSPDCRSLVFSQELSQTDSELFTMPADGRSTGLLLDQPDASTMAWAPAWSPTGDLIAYQTNPDTLFNVCLADVNGGSQGCLPRGNFSNAHPTWTPDGRLAFISNRDGDWDIYLTEVGSTTEPVQLTHNQATDMHPRFSPDGQFIVFESNRLDNFDIYLMAADGSNEVRLTSDKENDQDAAWLGNDQIVFASHRTADWELYLMNRDGTDVRRLTNQPGLDRGPAWCDAGN